MIKLIKKFWPLVFVITANIIISILFPQVGRKSFLLIEKIFINFLIMLTPIFICIGLMDVWVEKEAMIKIMGEKSGLRGILISTILGMVTAIPLYALLPVAGMLLKKGCKASNVLIFIYSCTSIRIPLLMLEVSSMGWKFTLIRFTANIFIIIIIAFMTDLTLTSKDKKKLYNNADLF